MVKDPLSGPKSKSDQGFSFYHWNLSIAAYNFSKIHLLMLYTPYNYINHYIFCLFEKHLNSGISTNNENLNIPGYRLVQSDHPTNDKQSGVQIYFKSSLPMQILTSFILQECINLEIAIDSELCNLICLYRSPSQNMEVFEMFVKNIDLSFEFIFNKNPYLTVVIGDANAESHSQIRPQLVALNLKS